jgi:hypothetical protein
MTAPLAATCIVVAMIVSAIVALGMAAERLRPLADRLLPAPAGSRRPPGPPARARFGELLACRQHEGGDERRLLAAEHVPEDGEDTPDAPRSAEILPFGRKPTPGRRAWRDDPPPDAA